MIKSLSQIEKLTGIKANTLRQRIFQGRLKATKIGYFWFLTDAQYKRMLKKEEDRKRK